MTKPIIFLLCSFGQIFRSQTAAISSPPQSYSSVDRYNHTYLQNRLFCFENYTNFLHVSQKFTLKSFSIVSCNSPPKISCPVFAKMLQTQIFCSNLVRLYQLFLSKSLLKIYPKNMHSIYFVSRINQP